MSTSALPIGRATSLASAPESTYGVAAAVGFVTRHAYAPVNLNRKNEPQDEEVLGRGLANDLDDQDPAPDIEEADVSVPWCFDLCEVGFLLRELFGAPSTSGSTNLTHVFTSGAAVLPSVCLEQKRGSGLYKMGLGLVAKKVVFLGGSGKGYGVLATDYLTRQVTANYADAIATGGALASPQPTFTLRVPKAAGTIQIAGARPGRVLDWSLSVEPQLDPDSYDGDNFLVSDVAVIGYKYALALTARFSGAAMEALGDIASGQVLPAAMTAELDYVLGTNDSLKIALAAMRFSAVSAPVSSGGKMTIALQGRGEATAGAAALTATLKNQFAGYA